MNFLKEIREHLKDFESNASGEIHRFIDFLHTRYQEPGPAVVAPPAPLATPAESTFIAPILTAEPEVVQPEPEVIEEPVAEEPAVETPEVEAPAVEEAAEEVKSSKKAK